MVHFMPTKKPESVKNLMRGTFTELAALRHKAQEHQTLLEAVAKSLPEVVRDHVVAAVADGETLTVVCDSAPWATRVRFYSESLLENLAPDHKSTISAVTVKVRPRWYPV